MNAAAMNGKMMDQHILMREVECFGQLIPFRRLIRYIWGALAVVSVRGAVSPALLWFVLEIVIPRKTLV